MATLSEGTTVAGRFVVAEEIGSGGMGAVYRARQTSLDREVALKVLHSDVAFTARARRRFGREARAVARLNHPHIASVFDFGTDNDDQTLWLAMELVDGSSLIELKHDSLDVLRLVTVTDQILSALSAAHARGIIHRDLKPSNILLSTDDANREIIKLVDFGLAATHTDGLDLDGAPGVDEGATDDDDDDDQKRVILGTPRYMAPELFRRKPVKPGVDLYALGVILFEIITGRPPYPGDDPSEIMQGHLHEEIPRITPRNGDLPSELERCIYRLLAKDPSQRYESAAEVRQTLQQILNQFSFAPWTTTGPGPASPRGGDPRNMSAPGHLSRPGFLGGRGGQTIPPSNMMRGDVSQFGPGGAPRAPLVGRKRERRSLERMVRKAVNSDQGGIAFLEGEAGIGKSRLVEWIRVRIEEAGIMRVGDGTFSRGGSGFSGVRDVLATILNTDQVDPDDLAEYLAEQLSEWGFSSEEAELCLQLMTPGGDVAIFEEESSKSGVSVQERVFAMIENVLRCAGEQKPWMLVFEDLHHAGEEALAFLQHLAVGMHLEPMPVVIVGTVRAEEVEQDPEMRYAIERLERLGPENVVRLQLSHLDAGEAKSLVLKLAPVNDELAAQIASRASGNPLHVTQILGYLQDGGKLEWVDGGWSLADGIDIQSELPDETADLMRYRLTRLTDGSDDAEAVRAILDRAAIVGNRFDYELLREFVEQEQNQPWVDELDDVLEQLVEDGYFREVGAGGRDVLEFTHDVMRDVLLQEMEGRRSKRPLHRIAAEAKKVHYGDRYREHALEFVEHYRQAREPSGVYAYTVKAARNAVERAQLDEAMRLYRDARQLADDNQVSVDSSVLDGISGVLSGQEVRLEVAHLERRVGEYDTARDHYRRLLDDSDHGVALWARWGLGEIDRRQGDLKDASTWFQEARRQGKDIWKTVGDDELRTTLQVVDTYSLFGLGRVAHGRGLYKDARRMLKDGLERAEKIQDRTLEARLLRVLGDTYWRLGDDRNAEVHFRRAAILEESIGERNIQAAGLWWSARFLREVGQPKKAVERAEKALEYNQELGQKHDGADCYLMLGHLAFSRGDFKTAARHLRQAHETYEQFYDRRGIARCNLALASLAFSVDRLKETQTLVLEARDTFRSIGDVAGLTEARLLVGRLHLAAGNPGKALEKLTQTVQHFDRIGERRLIACARAFYALALKETGADGEAHLVIEKILEDVPDLALAEESIAAAFDKLIPRIEEERPEFARQMQHLRQEIWQRLGRASTPAAV